MALAGLLLAVGCGRLGGGGGGDGALSDEAADRLGVFVRGEGGELVLWQELGDTVRLLSSRCSDADLVGVERDGVYHPVAIHGPGVCGAAGDVHPIDGPFPIDRADGVTVILGGDSITFARPGDRPLDPAFTAGPLEVTQPLAVGIEGGDVRLQLDGDRLRGVTPCQAFETSLERKGSLLATGDVHHGGDCPDDQVLFDVLANRTLAAIATGDELALLAGTGGIVQMRPVADGTDPLPAAEGLDRTVHRHPAPVTGNFHALAYEIDGATRVTEDAFPFRIVIGDDGASWYADCNETNAGGRWDGERLLIHEAFSTAVGCPDLAQSADLSLWEGFSLARRDGRWVLTDGPLAVTLMPGPPVDPDASVPAGRWTASTIGWAPFNASGIDGRPVQMTIDDSGAATLDTGCRRISLRVSGGAVTADGDVPASTCSLDDSAASMDAWAEAIVTAEPAGLYRRFDQLELSGGGRSIELTPGF